MNNLYALYMSRPDPQQEKRNRKPGSRRRKTVKRCVCWGLFALILGLIAWNLIRYPLRGNTYDVLGISREEIVEVGVNHYGRTLYIADRESMETILSPLDCTLQRGLSDYIFHTYGGDWALSLITREGKKVSFGIFPGSGSENDYTRLRIGRYSYTCDKAFDRKILETYWEAEFKKDLE